MTNTAVFELVNTDPDNYSEVSSYVDVPWNCRRVKYWVDSVNTFANLALLMFDDFIEVQWSVASTKKFYFKELYAVDAMEVASVLNKLLEDVDEPKLKFAQDGPMLLITLVQSTECLDFKIIGMSHRAQLITGLYDVSLPLDCIFSDSTVHAPSVPYIYYGNKLYLTSDQGNVIKSSNVQCPTVIFRINEFLMSTLPILIKPRKEERDVVIADGTNFHEIRVKLVDRWQQPVILKSPMIVTIKMKPMLLDTPAFGWH
jgi:hypothetical protein